MARFLPLSLILAALVACHPHVQDRTDDGHVATTSQDWVGEAAPSVASVERSRLEIRVFSLNAWLVPVASAERRVRRGLLPTAVSSLDVDVACFQEVWLLSEAVSLGEGLEDHLEHAVYGGGGLVLLSRYPVLSETFEAFDVSGDSLFESLASKGVQDVVLDTPAGPLRVLNTHLVFEWGAGGEAHTAQLDQVAERLGDAGDMPTIVCGDFNMRSANDGRPARQFHRLTRATDLSPSLTSPRRATRLGWPREEGRRRGWDPDYVFYRSGAAARVRVLSSAHALDEPDTALSDHNALVVDFRVDPVGE